IGGVPAALHLRRTAYEYALIGSGSAAAFGGILALVLTEERNSLFLRTVSAPPLVFFGTYSYGLYMIHSPLMMWGGFMLRRKGLLAEGSGLGALEVLLIAGGLSIVLAVLSFRYLEQPFLRLKARFE